MAEFSIVEAALSGPNLIRRKPMVYLFWVGFQLVAGLAYLGFFFLLFGSLFKQIFDAALANHEPPTELFLSLIPRFGLAFLVIVPLAIIYYAMTRTAAARAIVRPEDDRFGYLRLSSDEVRVFVTLFVLGCIRVGAQMVGGILIGIVVAILLIITGGLHAGPERQFVVREIGNLILTPVLIYLFLKFALAVPQTLDQRRIAIFDSWKLTNGITWRMFLSYAIVFAISVVAAAITAGAVIGTLFAVAGVNVVGMLPLFQSNPQEALRQLMGLIMPVSIIFAVISAIVTPFFTALYLCPAAHIYNAIMGRTEDVF